MIHLPTRSFRLESQRAGRAAETFAVGGGAAEVDEGRDGGSVARRKGVVGAVKQNECIRGRVIALTMV